MKGSYKFTLNLGFLVIAVTFIYSAIFNGGSIPILPFNNFINNPKWILYSSFQMLTPTLIAYYLYLKLYKENIIISISKKSIFLVFFIFLYCLARSHDNNNLYGDELFYYQNSFNISLHFFNHFNQLFKFFYNVPFNLLLQIFGIIQWGTIFWFLFRYLNTITKQNVHKVLIIIFMLRILITAMGIDSNGSHPPLNYLIPSILGTMLGVNSFAAKISSLFSFCIFYIYLFNRLGLSYKNKFILVLSISTIPIVGYFSLINEQAIFSYFCFTVVLIELFFFSPKIVHLFLFVSIFYLFRQTSIVAYIPLFISITYNYHGEKKIVPFAKHIIENCTPIILIIPVFARSIIFGTPSTKSGAEIFDFSALINRIIDLDLIYNAPNTLGYFLLLPITLVLLLFFQRQYLNVLFLISIFMGYLLLHALSITPLFQSKYYFELYAFLFTLSIITIFQLIFNFKWINEKFFLKIYISFFLILYTYSQYFQNYQFFNDKNQTEFSDRNMYSNPVKDFNNSIDYVIDYLRTIDKVGESYIAGINYGSFQLVINGCNYGDVIKYNLNRKLLLSKITNEYQSSKLYPEEVHSTKNINYFVVSDNLSLENYDGLRNFEEKYGWSRILNLPKSQNFTDLIIFKRNI